MKIRLQFLPVIAVVSATLVLAACGGRMSVRQPASVTTAGAGGGGTAGEQRQAAEQYEQLAAASVPPQQQDYQLKAVEALIKAGEFDEADSRLSAVDTSNLPPSYIARKAIDEAQIALYQKQPARARGALSHLDQMGNLDPALFAQMYWLRAQAQLALDNKLGAVRSLVQRERYIASKDEIRRNQQELWNILETSSISALQNERYVAYDPVLRGWIDLALISIEYAANPHRLQQAVANWRKTYPGHPATDTVVAALAAPAPGQAALKVHQIALLLPITSPFEKAARAVYAGFMARDNANTAPDKPTVRLYDIGSEPAQAPTYYHQAVQDGADLVIGPLGREAAEYVARSSNLSVPTLLLSYVGKDLNLPDTVYQFGLTPEDEARQTAARAYLDGYRVAAILYPNNGWGMRLNTAFRSHWEDLGGIVAASQAYDPNESDHSVAIKRLFNIDESDARRTRLEATIKTKVEFEARRRQDLDFVFLAADAAQGRLLKPELNFFHALSLPVYATSDIFTGKPDPIYDTDLNGIVFGDMPWVLATQGRIEALKDSLEGDWQGRSTPLDRLYALGMDAYGVIPHLQRLHSDPYARYAGVTGGLSMDQQGRIHRQLVWARFSKGVPVMLDSFFGHTQTQEIENETEPASAPAPGAAGGATLMRVPAAPGAAAP